MASKLFKTVKKKASRLQDIVSVLQKLEEKKYIERLSKLFEEIFFEEQRFTITELMRIMSLKQSSKYLDLDEQFRQNTQLFKTNFEVISNILINEVWDHVTNSFQRHPEEKHQQKQQSNITSNPTSERGRSHQLLNEEQQQQIHGGAGTPIQNENALPFEASDTNQHNGESYEQTANNMNNNSLANESKILSKIALAKSQLIQNNSGSQSINNSFASQQDNWVRASLKQRNSSRSQDNLKLSFPATMSDSPYAKRMNSANNSSTHSKTNQSIVDIKRQSEKKLSNMNLSVSSSKSLSSSKLGLNSPFEQKNPLQTSFSRASRKLLDKELSQSPGPLDYRVDVADKLVRQLSPKATIGNTKRSCFTEEKLKMESCSQTPGPQYNVSQTSLCKPKKK